MEWELLAGLSPEERDSLLALARRRRYARNEIIFHQGDPAETLHLIESGRVSVRVTTPRGDVATLAVLGSGDFFGEMALITPPPARTATIVALEPTETVIIHRDAFQDIRSRSPEVNEVLAAALATQVKRLTSHLLEALFVPVQTRVFRRLLALGDVYAEGTTDLVIPLSQDDIAALAGATRPTVNSVLKDAERSLMIALGRGRIEVRDIEELRRRARS
ncbi:MAG: Crp/Fnr family transcriptional regulator [Actinomycetota bacterium]